jgi:uncharacterized BrkB/YihY/UPF0761 family membrane protein
MTKREIAFLLIGLGFGLLLSVAVTLEVFISLQHNSAISGYGIERVAVAVPILLLVAGIILLSYRTQEGKSHTEQG